MVMVAVYMKSSSRPRVSASKSLRTTVPLSCSRNPAWNIRSKYGEQEHSTSLCAGKCRPSATNTVSVNRPYTKYFLFAVKYFLRAVPLSSSGRTVAMLC